MQEFNEKRKTKGGINTYETASTVQCPAKQKWSCVKLPPRSSNRLVLLIRLLFRLGVSVRMTLVWLSLRCKTTVIEAQYIAFELPQRRRRPLLLHFTPPSNFTPISVWNDKDFVVKYPSFGFLRKRATYTYVISNRCQGFAVEVDLLTESGNMRRAGHVLSLFKHRTT